EHETQLQVQVRLGDFAHRLQNGEPCPLCGALEHPEPMSSEQATSDLAQVLEQKRVLKQQQTHLQQVANELARLANTAQNKQEIQAKINKDLAALQGQMAAHRNSFKWPLYSPEDKSLFGEQKQKNKKTEETIQNLESEVKQLRSLSIQKTDEVARFEKRLQSIIEQIGVAKGLIEQYTNQLHTLDEVLYKSHSESELIHLKQQNELNIARTIEDHQVLTQRLH
ncbi:hypothetical protein M8994_21165, partial [Brucella sp. 21LCYQ03]|nr:hypothetical protein [Brucella sp. 21LCYQ03]